jgi:hypothetical protein
LSCPLMHSLLLSSIVKGQYVVYEREPRNESLFLDIAGEVVAEIEEPASWKKEKNPCKRGGGDRTSMDSGQCSSS